MKPEELAKKLAEESQKIFQQLNLEEQAKVLNLKPSIPPTNLKVHYVENLKQYFIEDGRMGLITPIDEALLNKAMYEGDQILRNRQAAVKTVPPAARQQPSQMRQAASTPVPPPNASPENAGMGQASGSISADQAVSPPIAKSEQDRLDELKAKLKDSFVKEFKQNVQAEFEKDVVRQGFNGEDMSEAYFDLIMIDDLYNQFFDSIIKTYTAQTILAMEAEILTDDTKYEQLAKSMSRAFKGELPSQTTNGVSRPSLEPISNPAEVIQRASVTLATDLIQNSYIKPFKTEQEVSDIADQICLKGKTKHPGSKALLIIFTNQYLGPVLLTNKFDDEQKNKYIDTYQNLMAGMVNQMQKKGKPFYDKNIGLTNLGLDALSRYAAQAAQNPQLQNLSEKQQISYGKNLLKSISQDKEFKQNYGKGFPGGTAENERKVRDNITIYGEKAKSKLARKLINTQKTQQKIRGQATASNAYEDVKPQRPAPYPNASPEKATKENTQNSIDLEKALRALSAEQLKSYLEIAEDINPKSIIVTFNPVKQGYIISSNETEFNRGFKASSIGAAIAKAQAMAANSVHQSLTEAQPSIEVKMRKADRKLNSAQLDKNAENVQKLFNKTPREMLNHLLNDGATVSSDKPFDPSTVKVSYDSKSKKYKVHDDKNSITLNKDQMTQVVKILQTVYDKNPTNNKPEVEAQKPKRPFLNRLLQRLSKDSEKKNSPPTQKPL